MRSYYRLVSSAVQKNILSRKSKSYWNLVKREECYNLLDIEKEIVTVLLKIISPVKYRNQQFYYIIKNDETIEELSISHNSKLTPLREGNSCNLFHLTFMENMVDYMQVNASNND